MTLDDLDVRDEDLQALRTAYAMGYFQRPRACNLHTIGYALDVSATTASKRLRRAVEQLVEAALARADGPVVNAGDLESVPSLGQPQGAGP